MTAVARWQQMLAAATTPPARRRCALAVRAALNLDPDADGQAVADAADRAYLAGWTRERLCAAYLAHWTDVKPWQCRYRPKPAVWRTGHATDRAAQCPDRARTHLALGQACEACGVSVDGAPVQALGGAA